MNHPHIIPVFHTQLSRIFLFLLVISIPGHRLQTTIDSLVSEDTTTDIMTTPQESNPSPHPISTAVNSLSVELFKTLSGGSESSNMIFSPLSISSCLSMVMLGAKNRSETELFDGLKFSQSFSSASDVHSSYQDVMLSFFFPQVHY